MCSDFSVSAFNRLLSVFAFALDYRRLTAHISSIFLKAILSSWSDFHFFTSQGDRDSSDRTKSYGTAYLL